MLIHCAANNKMLFGLMNCFMILQFSVEHQISTVSAFLFKIISVSFSLRPTICIALPKTVVANCKSLV